VTEDNAKTESTPYSRASRLAKHGAFHLLIWLASFSAFAATESWSQLSNLGLAAFLGVITGIIAGLATTTFVHEWFHLLGAWWSGGNYEIPEKLGLFVFDWQFPDNSLEQFKTMSIGGTVGTVLAISLLYNWIPTDTPGRTAILAAALGSLAFAGAIEWPVLKRSKISGDPLAELSKINEAVLLRSLSIGVAVALTSALLM